MTLEYAADLVVAMRKVNAVKALRLHDHFVEYFCIPKDNFVFARLCGYILTLE